MTTASSVRFSVRQTLVAAALLTGFAAAQAGTATGATPADVALATRVQTALQQARSFQTKSTDVTVTAAGGQIALSGFVGYASDELPARTIAAAVPGVQGVTSTLRAWSTATDPNLGLPALHAAAAGPAMDGRDAALAAQVKAALQQAPALQKHGTDVDVTAAAGQVTLTGFIGYATDEAPALAAAAAVPGVQGVTSTLHAWSTESDPNLGVAPVASYRAETAAPAMSPSDAALAERVKAALLEAAPFQAPNVELVVTARNGEVDLSGWIGVDTDELPARAIAAQVSGVKLVTSHLHPWST